MDRLICHRDSLKWRKALLALFVGTAACGTADAAGKRPDLDIAALLPRLPTEVFDNTTEGIDEDELRVLRTRGNSENWKIGTKNSKKVVFIAKRPFSEVKLQPAQEVAATFVEALTFNEKAIYYRYWISRNDNGPLEAHKPSAVFRLFNEREDGKPGIDPKDAPQAIVEHTRQRERCAQTRKQAAPAVSGCENLPANAAQLRKQFSAEPRWVEIIDRIGKVVGD